MKLDSRYADYFPEYSSYFVIALRLLKYMYVITYSGKFFSDKLTEWLLEACFIIYQCNMYIYYKYAPNGTNRVVLSCCFCYWPPVCEVCPNYEVVEFQPRTFTTPYLGSVAYFYVAYLLKPPHLLLLPSNVLPPQMSSSALVPHGIIRPPGHHPSPSQNTKTLHPHFPHPSLPETDSSSTPSSPPFLLYSCRRRYHAATKTYFNIAFIFCSTAACFYQGSQNFPPPSYPVSFAHTSKIGSRTTHSATVACLLLTYSLRYFVPVSCSTLSVPYFFQVLYPSLCAFFPVTCCRNPTCTTSSFFVIAAVSTQVSDPNSSIA